MDDLKFWITIVLGLSGVAALVLSLRDSFRIKRVEDEITNEIDVDVRWSKNDSLGNTTCSIEAMLYPVTEVRIKVLLDEWFIEHLDPNTSQQRQFHAINSGAKYNIQFRDPATGRKYSKKRVVRFL